MQVVATVLILLLLGAPLLDWSVAIILIHATRQSSVQALRERALLAVGVAIATTVYLLLVFNTQAGFPWWDNETGRTVVRLIIAFLGILPLYWLWLFATGRFRDRRRRL
jgi:hypothetical protein